jgi:hypothetical protein
MSEHYGWVLIRTINPSGFVADPDWVATQDSTMVSGAGVPVPPFAIPNVPGRPARGFAVMLAALNAAGAPIAPAAITATVHPIEVIYWGADGNRTVHLAAVEDANTALTAETFTLPANLAANVRDRGGGRNLFALRVSAVAAGAAAELRLYVKPVW